jgi:hypothetical protein
MAQIIDLGTFPAEQRESVKALALQLDPTALFVVGLARLKRDPMLVLQSDLEHKEKIFVEIVGEEHSSTLVEAYEAMTQTIDAIDSRIREGTTSWKVVVAELNQNRDEVKRAFDSLAASIVGRPALMFERPANARLPERFRVTSTTIRVGDYAMTLKRFQFVWNFVLDCYNTGQDDVASESFQIGAGWRHASVKGGRLRIGCQSWPLWQVEMVAEELGLT